MRALNLSDRRTLMRLGALVTTALVIAGVVLGIRATQGLPDDAAFEYAGDVVTQAELENRMEVLHALYGVQEPEGEDARATYRRDAAKAVAVSMILDDAARDEKIVISDKSARDTLDAMVAEQLGPDPQQAFTDLLSKFGVAEADILEEVVRQQTIARLFQEITEDAADSVTEEDAQEYYDDEPERFATPERREIANIVVSSQKEARTLLRRLGSGADFAALARAHSLDDATRDQGGALGAVASSELEKEYAAGAFGAASGAVFGPVRTDDGWNVGIVRTIVPAHQPTYAEVADQARESLRSERALKAWRDWLKDRIERAEVEYADAYRPSDPNEPPALATDLP